LRDEQIGGLTAEPGCARAASSWPAPREHIRPPPGPSTTIQTVAVAASVRYARRVRRNVASLMPSSRASQIRQRGIAFSLST
jgi:hypothetical protein